MRDQRAKSSDCSSERRGFLRAVGAGTLTLSALGLRRAFAADASGRFAVTTVNHLSYSSPNYKVTRDFYIDLFGMRDVWDDGTKCQLDCGPEDAPNSFYMTQGNPGIESTIAHFAFGLPNFWERSAALKDDLLSRQWPGVHPDGEAGWFVNGPSGYVQHIVTVKDPAMFPGAAAPCEVARSEACKAAYALGVGNLKDVPKPSVKGFRALYFKYIVLRVPDVSREAEFYTTAMGMTPVARQQDNVALGFGENTLVLKPAGAGRKAYCNEFGLVVSDYDERKVRAELERRGVSFRSDPAGGLLLKDPNGLEVGIAGRA